MQTLEEYIAKRKIEDGMNEFDTSQKMNNIRTCIDYIFEYFDQYLPIQGAEKRTVAENEKLLKYEKTLSEFSPDVRDWLVSIYDTYGKQLNRNIAHFVNDDDTFLFMYEEAEFRSLSYDCYASLIKKCPLKNQYLQQSILKEEPLIWESGIGFHQMRMKSILTNMKRQKKPLKMLSKNDWNTFQI